MVSGRMTQPNRAVTLIELLIAMAVTAVLTGVITLTLRTGFDTYSFGQEQVLLEKALDDSLEEIGSGGFESYGIKDALEVLSVSPVSIAFVPLWVDESHRIEPSLSDKPQEFILERPFKAGASLPIAEVSEPLSPADLRQGKRRAWRAVPITFIQGARRDASKVNDKVSLNIPVDSDNAIRFVFQPEAKYFPDCVMTIGWDGKRITRTYRGKADTLPKYDIPGITLANFKFQYFDNTNTEVEPRNDLIPNITAIKLNLESAVVTKAKRAKPVTKNGFVFINIRNTRTAGTGLIIRQGSHFKIPDSRRIRVFTLANVVGAREGGIIEIEARPKEGKIWKVRIQLGYYDGKPALKKYFVEYPAGRVAYSETINLTTNIPLNFLTLGANNRYDYDFDKDGNNVVNLEGDVELVVTRMDATGAALFIRP